MKTLHINGQKPSARPQHPGHALDCRRGAEQVVERAAVENEIGGVFQASGNRPVEIVNDLRALIAAMVHGAYCWHAQEAEKRIVAYERLTFPSPRPPVDDAIVVRQFRRDERDGPDHIGGMLRRKLHGLPPKQQHVAADRTIFVLTDDRFGNVGSYGHCGEGSTRHFFGGNGFATHRACVNDDLFGRDARQVPYSLASVMAEAVCSIPLPLAAPSG